MNDTPLEKPTRRSLLFRLAIIPALALINFAINTFGFVMATRDRPDLPPPDMLQMFLVGSMPAIAWVVLSLPVQWVTRRLARRPLAIAIAGHLVLVAASVVMHSTLTLLLREGLGLGLRDDPLLQQIERHAVGFLPMNLVVYTAVIAGTLAWDNWRLSRRRERTATQLATELTRAQLAALRSKVQPHFLFNALHGISSVMDTDVPKARRMMVALSHLLRTSLSANGDSVPLESEVRLTRDYLDLF